MKRELRLRVYNKFDGHCAYCGKKIKYEEMQVDHIVPLRRNYTPEQRKRMLLLKKEGKLKNKEDIGTNKFDNLNPACRRCNVHKGTLSIDEFRKVISDKLTVLRSNWHYRMAKDYGLLKEIKVNVKFYFERT